jgi:hypothetical protein
MSERSSFARIIGMLAGPFAGNLAACWTYAQEH